MESLLTFIGVLVAGFFTIRATLYTIESKNIKEERIKWREKIRELTPNLLDRENTKKEILAIQICSRLNPIKDRELCGLVKKIASKSSEDSHDEHEKDKLYLTESINHLLKHDWERCKNDSSFFGFMRHVNDAILVTCESELKIAYSLKDDYYKPKLKIKADSILIVISFILSVLVILFLILIAAL